MSTSKKGNTKTDPAVKVAAITAIAGVVTVLITSVIAPVIQNSFNSKATTTPQAGSSSVPRQDATQVQPDITVASSDFENSDEKWQGISLLQPSVENSIAITRSVLGGYPGGFITIIDGEGDSYFAAPEKYLGDKSAAYGGTLSFDLRTSGQDKSVYFDADDVILTGGGIQLAFRTHVIPETVWTSYAIALSESSGWMNRDTGQRATRDEIKLVLSSLTELLIRGEFLRGVADQGGIDNVAILRHP